MTELDLNEEKTINWLSVGPYDAVPGSIYQHEYRDDLMPVLRIPESPAKSS